MCLGIMALMMLQKDVILQSYSMLVSVSYREVNASLGVKVTFAMSDIRLFNSPLTPQQELTIILFLSMAQVYRSSSNEQLGSVESDGTIRNANGSCIGKIERDGTIRNSSNSRVGKIESDGVIRNGNNSCIGKVESDGTVRDGNNSRIGKIESDGTIRNGNGSPIGKASGIDKKYVAAIYFMGIL